MKSLNIKHKIVILAACFVLSSFLFFPVNVEAISCANILSSSVAKDLIETFKLTITPNSGPMGKVFDLQGFLRFVEDVPSNCKDYFYFEFFNEKKELLGTSKLFGSETTGDRWFESSKINRTATSAEDSNNDAQLKYQIHIKYERTGLDFDLFTDSRDFIVQGSGGGLSCMYLDTRDPDVDKWKCHGKPDPNTGKCPTECDADAERSGANACIVGKTSQCGNEVKKYIFGCLSPQTTTESKWLCTAKIVAVSVDCSSLDCNGGACLNMTTTIKENLCGTTVLGGTGGGNCGAPPLPACPTGETKEYPFQVPNPLQGDAKTVADLVGLIVKWIFSIAIPIAVAVIVYSGILFLTSKGDPAQVTKAKQFLTYAVIGLAIILVGSGFISLIRSILELSG